MRRANIIDWSVLALLAVAAVYPAMRAGNSDFTYPDASRHAMDGAFLLDSARELPLEDPLAWAKRYYTRSPALGIGRYPPLFAAIEAAFFAILGVSPFAGRLASAIIWLAGLVFFYETVRVPLGRGAAAFAALALAAGPASVRWGSEVMLELPAIGFLLAGAYLYTRFIDSRSRGWFTAAMIVVSLAGWIKQPAALMLPVLLIDAIFIRKVERRFRTLRPGIICAAALTAPLAALSAAFGSANVALAAGTVRSYSFGRLENYLCYIRAIPSYYLGFSVAVFAGVGALYAVLTRKTDAALWALWAAVFYCFFTIVGLKTPRLIMFWTPALAYFAGLALALITSVRARAIRAIAYLAGAAAVGATFSQSLSAIPRPSAHIREAAVRALAAAPDRILYLGPANGTFVFRVRQIAGYERPTVVRASKVLYVDAIQEELGRTEIAASLADVKEAVARVSPDIVCVERGRFVERDLPSGVRAFLEYLRTDAFELLDVMEDGGLGTPAFWRIELYGYRGPRREEEISLPMPGVGMNLKLPAED